MHVWGVYTCFDEKYPTCLHLVTWDHLPIWPPIVGFVFFVVLLSLLHTMLVWQLLKIFSSAFCRRMLPLLFHVGRLCQYVVCSEGELKTFRHCGACL